jgi:DNA-binding MarR family transcriptional regulator
MVRRGRHIRDSDYAALAEVRYRIRQFLRGSDEAAAAADLEPQQYQLLLALRALPHQSDATIRRLAERLYLKHHSVVGLVDRLEERGCVRRYRNIRDQREVLVMLLPRGRAALEQVVGERLHELHASGQGLVDSIAAILKQNRAAKNQRPASRSVSSRKTTERNEQSRLRVRISGKG